MLLAQQPIEAEVARFAGEQIAVEGLQLRIGAVLGQQCHALMAAGLNQARHQEAVELAQRLLAANLPGQPRAIGRSRQGPQGDAAALQ